MRSYLMGKPLDEIRREFRYRHSGAVTDKAHRLGVFCRQRHRRPLFDGLPTPAMRAWIENEGNRHAQ